MRTFTIRKKDSPGLAHTVFAIEAGKFLVAADSGEFEWVPVQDCVLGAVFRSAEERVWWQSLSGPEHEHGGVG